MELSVKKPQSDSLKAKKNTHEINEKTGNLSREKNNFGMKTTIFDLKYNKRA